MDNLYSYEHQMKYRRQDLQRELHDRRMLREARTPEEPIDRLQNLFGELAQPRRVLRLGRLVIMW